MKKTKEMLIEHYQAYPMLKAQDVFKFIYQSAFGCEHLVSNRDFVESYIRREYEAASSLGRRSVDKLDGEYSRVHLSWIDCGLSFQTLAKIFCLSAKKESNGEAELLLKLNTAKELIKSGEISLDVNEFENEIAEWEKLGYPAVHHSERFREEYHPAYRVVANKYVEILDVLSEIDKKITEKDSVTVVIEGGSASGKSTLAEILSDIYDCNVFHMDDFFLRPEQRTSERLSEIGGNVDRERFADEILAPLKSGGHICYRPFDCSIQALRETITVEPKKITVIEGAYSMHTSFGRYYDLSIFLDISPDQQRERILRRNSMPFANRFFNEWIPMETKYFEKTAVKGRADFIHKVV